MTEVRLTGLKIGESARWHDGRLWLSNWGTQQILAVDLDGNAEVMATVPTTMPFSIDWLPDGRLVVVAGPEGRLLRQEPDGSLVDHADLRGLDANLNEIVVDGRGRIYVNRGTDFHPGEGEAPRFVALVTPDGVVRRVAEGIAFPNGMAVTPDNSTLIVSESFAGTLTALRHRPGREPVEPARVGRAARRRHCPGHRRSRVDARMDRDRPGLSAGRRGRRGAGHGTARPGRVRVHARGRGRPNAVHARSGLANAGRLRGQHQAPDDRTRDRPGPHRPRPGRPRRPPLNDRHGRARLAD
jgi:hypothetical protein